MEPDPSPEIDPDMPNLESEKPDYDSDEMQQNPDEEDEELEADLDEAQDNLMREMIIIAGGEDYVGSLDNIEILFT